VVDKQRHLAQQRQKLLKAIAHLEYSFNKIQSLPDDIAILDEEQLETWESFSARVSRVTDIFIMKYIRTLILINDPGFSGSVRDMLDQAEKLHIIDECEFWLKMRGLRNVTVHDYKESDINQYFAEIKAACPRLIAIKTMQH